MGDSIQDENEKYLESFLNKNTEKVLDDVKPKTTETNLKLYVPPSLYNEPNNVRKLILFHVILDCLILMLPFCPLYAWVLSTGLFPV